MTAFLAARKLLERCGYPPLPIRLNRICDFLGIGLYFHNLDSLDGYFMYEGDSALIVINESRAVVRQRFSVAHELGHLVMGHGAAGFVGGLLLEGRREKWKEVHANRFASELLMPEVHLAQFRASLTSEKLSRICHVSEEAARIRLEQLGWR